MLRLPPPGSLQSTVTAMAMHCQRASPVCHLPHLAGELCWLQHRGFRQGMTQGSVPCATRPELFSSCGCQEGDSARTLPRAR